MGFKMKLDKEGALGKISNAASFRSKIMGVLKRYVTKIVREAQTVHRFKSQTGFLERSVISELNSLSDRIVVSVLSSPTIASYGQHIHNGFRSWRPDPFITKAFEKFIPQIRSDINKIIEEAL